MNNQLRKRLCTEPAVDHLADTEHRKLLPTPVVAILYRHLAIVEEETRKYFVDKQLSHLVENDIRTDNLSNTWNV